MKYIFCLLFITTCSLLSAQDDLLKNLAAEDQTTTPVVATFKGQRVINSQTNEQLKKRHLNFNILHRFGDASLGYKELYGLDQAYIRFLLDYGITDKMQVSFGRSNLDKMYDLGFKAKIFEQKKGYKPFPLSISYYGNMGINTSINAMFNYGGNKSNIVGRLNFTHQIIIAQKINEKFSYVINPTAVWYNLVDLAGQKNFALFLGMGVSTRISRSTRFNIEYFPRLTDRGAINFSGVATNDYLGVGFDIETGGHVFQLMLTNSSAMLEQQFLTQTSSSWSNFGVRLGFNISRTYSFAKE